MIKCSSSSSSSSSTTLFRMKQSFPFHLVYDYDDGRRHRSGGGGDGGGVQGIGVMHDTHGSVKERSHRILAGCCGTVRKVVSIPMD